MFSCMRTTIDLPDSLMERAKRCSIERKLTFRALVIFALEQALETSVESFELRDASAGHANGADGNTISNTKINQAIDAQRATSFEP